MNKLLLALILVAMSSIANANLIQNGSFEDINVAAGTYSVFGNGVVNGWAVTSGSGIEIRNNLVGKASNGNNFVELDSNSNSSMSQAISTTAGSLYDLTFDFSARIGVPANSGISVFWNGVLKADYTADGTNATENNWVAQLLSLTGTGGSGTGLNGADLLEFVATGLSDGLGPNLDNITLTENKTPAVNAVPVPAAVWLFSSALGFLGFMRRSSV